MSEGREYYREIAEELGDPETTLEDLDPEAVETARVWAKRNHQKWPPKPVVTGWKIDVYGIRKAEG